jgi:protein arginine N-methyltransferase 2
MTSPSFTTTTTTNEEEFEQQQQPPPPQQLITALQQGDEYGVRLAVAANEDVTYQDFTTGKSCLMFAAEKGMADSVQVLLDAGAPWNALDRNGRCAGDYAVLNNNQIIVDMLVSAGVQAELIFAAVTKQIPVSEPRNSTYLSSQIQYSEDGTRLIQASEYYDAVMMEWERPLMKAHVQALCDNTVGLRILNIGFGLGIIDNYFQECLPSLHVIVEAHPGVLEKMKQNGWFDKPNVRIVPHRWQDVDLSSFGPFDAIFFDTFGEYLDDLREFHETLPRLLSSSPHHRRGRYSFFNGMCPNSLFFQGVACEVVRLQLRRLKLDLQFHPLEIDSGGDEVWNGIARKYFSSSDYYLPLATIMDDVSVNQLNRADRKRNFNE